MATPVNPTTTEPGGALFRALRSVDVDPDLAYEAAEEVRRQAGENVIATLGAQINELKAKIDTQSGRVKAKRWKTFAHVAALAGIYLVFSFALGLGLQISPFYGNIGIAVTVGLVVLYVYIGFLRK